MGRKRNANKQLKSLTIPGKNIKSIYREAFCGEGKFFTTDNLSVKWLELHCYNCSKCNKILEKEWNNLPQEVRDDYDRRAEEMNI